MIKLVKVKCSKRSAGGIHCSLLTSLSVNMIYSRIMHRVTSRENVLSLRWCRACTSPPSRRIHTFIYTLQRASLGVASLATLVGYVKAWLYTRDCSSLRMHLVPIISFCSFIGRIREKNTGPVRTCFFSTQSFMEKKCKALFVCRNIHVLCEPIARKLVYRDKSACTENRENILII